MVLTSKRRRVVAPVIGAALAASGLAACGSDSGPPVLTWYVNPDNGGQADLAEACTDEAGGDYRIETSVLPNDADGQREQLARRLAAEDSGVDLMSLDPPFVPEFAQAGWLLDIPDDQEESFTEGIVESAVRSATWDDQLAAIPFWANTQLLWYRTSVVEEAGLDPEAPLVWEQVISAAEETGTTVAVQGNRYEGYTVLVNALLEGAGTSVIVDPAADVEDLEFGLDGEEAQAAAQVLAELDEAGVLPPGTSTADETASLDAFRSDDGGFMLNWPFVWTATQEAVESGAVEESVLEDIGWTLYPATTEQAEPAPPFGGIHLGIGAYSEHPELALAAAECITTPENQKAYFLSSGNPAAAEEVYADPEVQEAYPMAETILESLRLAAPRPLTPYYGEVSQSIQRTWHPISSVDPESTPESTADLIEGVLAKEDLL